MTFGGDDFHRLTVFQPRPQRHADAVNLGRHARVPDARMDRIGIIQRRRSARQLHNIALGRKAEHLIGIHLKLHVLEKLVVILFVQTLGQAGNPFGGINGKGVLGAHALAVGPVRGHASLGHFMHLTGADLHLNPLAVAARHRGMD